MGCAIHDNENRGGDGGDIVLRFGVDVMFLYNFAALRCFRVVSCSSRWGRFDKLGQAIEHWKK